MRSVPEHSSVGGPATGRDPWAGFGAAAPSGPHRTLDANGSHDADDERAVADLARRLQDRVDGQEALLDRIADLAQRPDERARVSELRDTTHRMRRDSEALLLLCGAEPGVHRGAAHTVPAVLADAVALVDEPSRVVVRTAPGATLAGAAAVELRHLVAELVDEAGAASPGARVELGARFDPDGTLVVEVVVAGRGWTDALGGARRSAFGPPRLAERLARRSATGIRLHRPLIDEVEGLVATLHCPAHLLTTAAANDPWPLSRPARPAAAGYPPPQAPAPAGGIDQLLLAPTVGTRRGDELFGPLPTAVGPMGTPIFEAVASAWFRDDERGPVVSDWRSPGDDEWQAAAARATRSDQPVATTASGLPRRSPGDRLVPPPRASRPAASAPDERIPERVRDRLATYQRGLRQGRHRAADAGLSDPGGIDRGPGHATPPDGPGSAWAADGW